VNESDLWILKIIHMSPRATRKAQDQEDEEEKLRGEEKENFPLICKPRQCLWCLDDERRTFRARSFEYTRVSKMLDEADRHLRSYRPNDQVPCPHPVCKAVEKILKGKMQFMNHAAKDHGIYLRVQEQ
jgi:hypothetical protein